MDGTQPGWSTRVVAETTWSRLCLRTPWLTAEDDLSSMLRQALTPHARPGDTVAVSEKIVVLLTGGAIPAADVVPGRLAIFLSRRVQPVGNSRGLSIPEKMQLVLDRRGRLRVLVAAASAALLRPLGRRGSF